MKKLITVFIITSGMTFLVSSFNNSETTRHSIGQQSNQDSLEKDRAKYVAQIMETIKGKENMRADSVFKNIKMLKMLAARFVSRTRQRGRSPSADRKPLPS